MKILTNISVSRKLALIVTVTTATALLLISVAFIAYDHFSSRTDALERLATVGNLVAGNSTAALAFDDEKSAAEVLGTLREEPAIQVGCTYRASGQLVSEYRGQNGGRCPKLMELKEGAAFTSEGAVYRKPILLHGVRAGFVYLRSDLAKMRFRRSRFIAITVIFLLGSLGAGVLLGTILRHWITTPIVELASVMQRVSQSKDYSLRAASRGSDEIGQLVFGFNQMLTEIQFSQAKLEIQALNDELTGLPNRRLLADRLAQALAQAKRERMLVAVLYLDMDGFNLVNDTLGHFIGDRLLRQVAIRLRRRIRAADTLARIGGDEFTVVAPNIHNTDDAELIAENLLAELSKPFIIDENDLALTASIGVSFYPNDSLDAEQLLQQAATAMYAAKATGKNKFTLYSAEFGDLARERLKLKNELRSAIERGELMVYYQPEFCAGTGRLVRFESLARWKHSTLGVISPLKFIPIAEESGLIIPLGLWVLEQACTEALRWQGIAGRPVQVAVNISAMQFLRDDFADSVADILRRTGLSPNLLQLELTESVVIPGVSVTSARMSKLQSLGVTMALDDFGTGYSSLSYLPQMSFNCLKIDRTFFAQISASPDPRAMLQSLVDLARNLRMTVIVEGIETQEELSLARETGCDEVQGYLLGRPTADPEADLTHSLDHIFDAGFDGPPELLNPLLSMDRRTDYIN